jgi:hypothetical protein
MAQEGRKGFGVIGREASQPISQDGRVEVDEQPKNRGHAPEDSQEGRKDGRGIWQKNSKKFFLAFL